MASSLMSRMLKTGSVSGASILSESSIFTKKDFTKTDLPVLNIAFSGNIDGGLVSGLSVIAGFSKTFKSALSLYCMKAYLDKYPDAIAVLYDTEFGITEDYIKTFGIDPSRVAHIPVEHIEMLKFDMTKKLDELKLGDKVFFLVDSIGQISSKKEVEDAIDEKSVADMSRAKALRSLLRLVTIQLAKKDLPCIMVNHVYQTMETYAKTVIPGGTAVTYSANQIFVITKAQEKNSDGELDGWKFTINIEKSRFVKEKAKLPFQVMYEDGIQKYSGMLDIALETGHVIKPSMGWYSRVDDDGVVEGRKWRAKDTSCAEFWDPLFKSSSFNSAVERMYKLSAGQSNSTRDAVEDLDSEELSE
jgi:RecA/RadA recombinase